MEIDQYIVLLVQVSPLLDGDASSLINCLSWARISVNLSVFVKNRSPEVLKALSSLLGGMLKFV